MVESAIIFPLVILAAISLVYLFISIYSQLCFQANMHILLRQEVAAANDLTTIVINDAYERDKYRQIAENESIEFSTGMKFITRYLESSKTKNYSGGGLTVGNKYERKFYGRYYVLNEANIVRNTGIVY